jgi:hypothetical protein
MSSFDPETEYITTSDSIRLKEFHDYSEEFVTRPPYQRKAVWSRKKQQALLDSLFRGYYIPRIVVRKVSLGEQETVREIIDGQQRITTAQRFLAGELPLPKSLKDIRADLPGSTYDDLSSEVRRFVDRLAFEADVVMKIDDPYNPRHQHIATEIFWRLQQGESLNYMEVAHARLSSLVRNFVVKYADDQTFDYDCYQPVDDNPSKHRFFSIVQRKNNRMQHMALLTRFLMLEEADGPTDIKRTDIGDYIDRYEVENGIGSENFESKSVAQSTLSNLNAFYEAFEDDPLRAEGGGLSILKTEYFIISLYLLLRHLRKHYVFGDNEKALFQDFAYHFYDRWRNGREEDTDVQVFQNNRQQSGREIATRHRIIRQHFFDYAQERGFDIVTKDKERRFDEAERIRIYRRDDGLCQACLEDGKPPEEARVPWEEYEADHVIPHSKGGETVVRNGQVLCAYHNRVKGPGDLEGGRDSESPHAEEGGDATETDSSMGRYWLTPVADRGELSPEDVIQQTVGNGQFGFSSDAMQRMRLRPGDQVAFYGSQTGVVAEATVQSRPARVDNPSQELQIPEADSYPYIVDLGQTRVFDEPVELSERVREALDAFEGKDPSDSWGWFVLTVRELSAEDYETLTRP